MTTLSDLRVAIASAVATIDGLRATPLISDQINPPQAVVYRKTSPYDEVMHPRGESGSGSWAFGVMVYVARTNERAAQDLLDEYAEETGDKSLKATIETDADLAAVCDYVLVTQVGDVQVATIGAVDYLAEEFTLEVVV